MSGGPPEHTDDDDNEFALSSPGHRRFRLRSSSFSAWAAKIPSKISLSTASNQSQRSLGRKRRAKRSVTFEELLASDEIRQQLSLTGKDTKKTAIYQEPAPGEFRGHIRKSEENSRATNEHGQDALPPCGSVRRHHMRTVSQDDYLLARGADPRTGIVTPGHSLQNSVDEQATLQARAAAGESKWRQRGNQWISLGLDQPTPTGSPPKLDLAEPLQHQIPRKPVGSPPRKGTHDRERSSSAPTPRKFKYFQPSDVEKRSPDASQKPFLGHLRASETANVLNKGLRCPPMNSILSLSPLSNQVRLRIPHGSRLSKMPKPSGPRGGDPSYPHLRYQKPQIPPRHYHLIQDLQADQTTNGPRRPLRHERDIEVVHPPFQPQSLRGRISGPEDMATQDGNYQHYVTEDIFTTQSNTISMNTDTRIPSSMSNDRLQSEWKPSENMSLPMNRTRPWGLQRPHMPGRSDEMTDLPKLSMQSPDHQNLSQMGTGDGSTDLGHIPRQKLNLTGMSDGATDVGLTPDPVKPNKTDCRVGSLEDKLRNMPGSIHMFDGPAEAEVNIGDDTTPSQATIGSDRPRRTIATTKQAVSYGGCAIGLDEDTAACLELLLITLMRRLLEMGSRIIQTLGKVLRMWYVYSETGNMKMEGMLVLDVLRSIVHTLILGAVAVALARVVGLAVKVGTGIVWVLKGICWVLR
jgi:hypothetical protein